MNSFFILPKNIHFMINNTIVFFDGICNLCSGLVIFLIRHIKNDKLRFASLQSNYAKKQLPSEYKDCDSIVVEKNGEYFIKSEALFVIIKELSLYWRIFLIAKIFPRKLRDRIYDYIAYKRYKWFGKRENCLIPTDEIKSLFLDYSSKK